MRARRTGYWTAVAASIAVLAAGVLLAVRSEHGAPGPGDVVRSYFAALGRSDAAEALAYADGPGGPTDFLTSDVLALQQHLAPLHDVEIVNVDGAGSVRTVGYSYSLGFPDGDRTVTGDVRVTHHGNAWRLVAASVPVHLELSTASGRATLAGAAVPDEAIALFPGAVPVSFDTAELEVAHGSVTFGASADVTLTVAVSAAGRAALRTALETQLRACFGASAAPQCPLPDDPRIVPGSLRGTIDTDGIDQLDYAVELRTSGPIRIDGTLAFDGSYQRLDKNNIARTHRGRLTVQVRAVTPSVPPVRLQLVGATT